MARRRLQIETVPADGPWRTPARAQRPALPAASERDELSARWLGHASVLIRVGGVTILTDPVLSDRVGVRLGKWTIGVERVAAPALTPADLPPIDLVLLSHAHFDHLDRPTLRAIASDRTTVVTPRNVGRVVPRGFRRVIELPWGRQMRFRGLCIRSIEPAHWGARIAWDRHREYAAFSILAPDHSVLFGGDTAMTNAFSEFGPIDLGILGIGAYEPEIHNHATPEQAWEMFVGAGGRYLLPMHHSTFALGNEPLDEPMQRLLACAGRHADRVVCRVIGEAWVGTDAPLASTIDEPVGNAQSALV